MSSTDGISQKHRIASAGRLVACVSSPSRPCHPPHTASCRPPVLNPALDFEAIQTEYFETAPGCVVPSFCGSLWLCRRRYRRYYRRYYRRRWCGCRCLCRAIRCTRTVAACSRRFVTFDNLVTPRALQLLIEFCNEVRTPTALRVSQPAASVLALLVSRTRSARNVRWPQCGRGSHVGAPTTVFCQATIFYEVKPGYLGAYMNEGFTSPLLLQVQPTPTPPHGARTTRVIRPTTHQGLVSHIPRFVARAHAIHAP